MELLCHVSVKISKKNKSDRALYVCCTEALEHTAAGHKESELINELYFAVFFFLNVELLLLLLLLKRKFECSQQESNLRRSDY